MCGKKKKSKKHITWDILILKNYSSFIWNSNLTGYRVFHVTTLSGVDCLKEKSQPLLAPTALLRKHGWFAHSPTVSKWQSWEFRSFLWLLSWVIWNSPLLPHLHPGPEAGELVQAVTCSAHLSGKQFSRVFEVPMHRRLPWSKDDLGVVPCTLHPVGRLLDATQPNSQSTQIGGSSICICICMYMYSWFTLS